MPESYNFPPIEHVELRGRYAQGLTKAKLEELYPFFLEESQDTHPVYGFTFAERGGKPSYRRSTIGRTFDFADGLSVILTRESIQVISKGAYKGWAYISDKFLNAHEHCGRPEMKSVGTLFVNKISIDVENSRIELGEYFDVFISDRQLQECGGSIGFFQFKTSLVGLNNVPSNHTCEIQVVARPANIEGVCEFTVNVQVDSYDDKSNDLGASVERLRTSKNASFEAVVTDKTRALFRG